MIVDYFANYSPGTKFRKAKLSEYMQLRVNQALVYQAINANVHSFSNADKH